MAEIIIGDDETPPQVARELLAQAEHPDHVVWTPRSNTPHGGVFIVPDDKASDLVARRENARAESERLVQQRQDAADERDQLADQTGLTPAELGFAANSPEDAASLGQGGPARVVDPLRSEDQRLLELQARVDGVAEAQDAQVARAQDRADEDEDAAADEAIAAEDKAAADRAAARKTARRASAKKAAEETPADESTSDKE
jgi:hypothetical protein